VKGTTCKFVEIDSRMLSSVTMIAGRTNPASLPTGHPKSTVWTSPERIGDRLHTRRDHGNFEGDFIGGSRRIGRGQHESDLATTFVTEKSVDEISHCNPVAIGKLSKRFMLLDRHGDRCEFGHGQDHNIPME
jgi:hypothetical protein